VNDDFIPFHRPSITDAERAAVIEVLDSGWLTTGPKVRAFEEAFAAFVGAPHAIALNSATAGLHLALEGLGVGEGDEVVVPTYTFAASGETALYLRARPVLVDCDPATLNIAPAALERAITARTRAVQVVHVAGLPVDIAAVDQAIVTGARRGGLDEPPPIVEDAAHAFPSRVAACGGRFAGTIGRAGAFSFYATKTITTGEGGMLVTGDDALAARVRQMSLHGISRDAWKRYTAAGSWYYEIEAAGFKDNMTDLAAALGLAQLARADQLREARRRIAERYLESLRPLAAEGRVQLPATGDPGEHAWHLFVVRLEPDASNEVDAGLPGVAGLPEPLQPLATRRARTIERLREAGVGTSVHFIPLHLHPLYRSMGYRPTDFPAAESAYAGAISLPIWPEMKDGELGRVVAAVEHAIDQR
jgi:perosamine synthetase